MKKNIYLLFLTMMLAGMSHAVDLSNAKWYTIRVGNGGYLSTKAGYKDGVYLLLNNTQEDTSDYGLWTFTGNDADGYTFYNKVRGENYVLGMSGSEDGGRAKMVAATNTANVTKFDMGKNGTGFWIKDHGSAHKYWNKRGNYLAYWDNAAGNTDTGSRFIFAVQGVPAEFCVGKKGTRPSDIHDFSLWYDMPATATGVSDTWMEYALPVGNGQIGATIRGGVLCDNIQFNEKTLWSGTATNSGNQGYFQNFGSILVEDMSGTFSAKASDGKPIEDYNRFLDIIDGVAGVNFLSPDHQTTFQRRYFASATDHVFLAHYEAKGQEKMTHGISYAPDDQIGAGDVTYKAENNGTASATFSGKMQIVSYNTCFKVRTDGTVTASQEGIGVSNATWMDIIMAAATDYDASKPGCVSGATAAKLSRTVSSRIDAAADKDYTTLLADHKAAHSALMNRVSLQLGNPSTRTTENLVKFYNASDKNKTSSDGLFLEALYFQYGRYLTIGANLDNSIHAPSNLQGIWNDRSNSSFWHCDIHADINVQMNYWPADPANLSEMHLPFLNHILDLGAPGSRSPWYDFATKLKSGAKGWTVAVENNIFGGTSTWSNSNMKTLGAWYCTHLWRHYKYTMDKEFLRKALPVMYQCALFIKSISTKDDKGLYEIKDEFSPEHGPYDVTAFAQQTSYELLDEVMKGHRELGDKSPLTASQIAAIRDLYDNFDRGLWTETYGGKLCISEWKNNALSDPAHRHLSHLMCLYPFSQVSAFDQSAEGKRLFLAAYNGQIARNGDVTGWSMGWQTNTYSRCLDGNRARKNLSLALRHSGSYVIEMANHGGCYYNLFDAHSPFQIDGNYGCTSGICEMLLQSHDDIVSILPALPSAWKSGSVAGLKAQGNFTVGIAWADGKATDISITSNAGQPLRIRYEGLADYVIRLNGKEVVPIRDGESNVYTIPDVKQGDVVSIGQDDPNGIGSVRRPFEGRAEARPGKQSSMLVNLGGQLVGRSVPKKGIVVQEGRKVARK